MKKLIFLSLLLVGCSTLSKNSDYLIDENAIKINSELQKAKQSLNKVYGASSYWKDDNLLKLHFPYPVSGELIEIYFKNFEPILITIEAHTIEKEGFATGKNLNTGEIGSMKIVIPAKDISDKIYIYNWKRCRVAVVNNGQSKFSYSFSKSDQYLFQQIIENIISSFKDTNYNKI